MLPFQFMNLSFGFIPIMTMAFLFMINKKFNLLITICLINLVGLIPEFWCISSYLWGNTILSLVGWSLWSMGKIFNNFKFWSSHMLPLGSPFLLWPFLIILELISQLIRPLTLSLRLTCNMMAGHVLMVLILNMSNIMFLMVILLFETCVAIIQSVVFKLLIDSYKYE